MAVAVAIAALPLAGFAKNYYVDPVLGNDIYPGTKEYPLLTVEHALDGSLVGPGDTVYLRGGVYRPVLGPESPIPFNPVRTNFYAVLWQGVSGSAGKPITVSGYPGERAILKGSLIATNWQLVTDPEFTAMGFPPAGAGHIYELTNWMCDANNKLELTYGLWSAKTYPQQVFVSDSETNDGTALKEISWPSSFETTYPNGIIPFAKDGGAPPPGDNHFYPGIDGYPPDMVAGSFYYLEATNTLADTSIIYVWLPDGGDPSTNVMEVSVASKIFRGGQYTVVKNLVFRHCNNLSWDTAGGAVGVDFGGTMENCDIEWCDAVAVCSGPNTTLRNCTIAHVGMTGMLLQSTSRVDSCCFSDCNYRDFDLGWQSGAIKCPSSKAVLVQNCEFTKNNGACVWFDTAADSNAPPSIVRHNYFHDNGGVPRLEWADSTHTSIVTTRTCLAIEIEKSRNVSVYNNLLVSNFTYSFRLAGAQNSRVFNNIIAGEDSDWVGDGQHAWINFVMQDEEGLTPQTNQIVNNTFYNNINGLTTQVQINGGSATMNKCDYNHYYSSLTNFPIGFYQPGSPMALAAWRSFSGYDLHSVVPNSGLKAPSAVAGAVRSFQSTASRWGYNPKRH